jgi:hypothetical protein
MPGICPWWLTYTFDNPLRKLFQDPFKILSPYVRAQNTRRKTRFSGLQAYQSLSG